MGADSGSLATAVRDGRPGPAIEARDFKRAFARFQKDQITDHAAALTYYALMSLFPALLFGVALLGFFGQQALITEFSNFLVSVGAPIEIRKLAASVTSPSCPKKPSSATPNSSPGNSDSSA